MYVYSFSVLGGFYSDTEAFVNGSCRKCPNGTFVPLEKAPGKKKGDCIACPQGIIIKHGRMFSSAGCCSKYISITATLSLVFT